MPGPINSLRFVHSALTSEAAHIEAAITGAQGASDVAAVLADVQWYVEISDLHMKGEEAGLFPRLAEVAEHVDATYLHDHEEERARLAQLLSLTQQCSEVASDESLSKLRRLSVAVVEHIEAHVTKENTLILPLVDKHFPPPEQGVMLQKILSTIAPEKMARAVPWIVSRVSIDEAEAYVRGLAAAMPAPVFEKARGWIADGVGADRVAELRSRVAELGG